MEALIQEHLQGWQAKALLMMTRVTLIRSVLNSILIYLLSNTIILRTSFQKLEWLFRTSCGVHMMGIMGYISWLER